MKKGIVDRLVSQYGTRDPFLLAQSTGRILLTVPLTDFRGFYQRIHRCHIIYIAEGLTEFERSFVCAHELGHSFLHGGVNAAFIDSRTHFVKAKYEREADRFAIDLIMPDERFSELMYMPVHDIAESLGISDELANYRLDQIQMKFRDQ